MRFILICYFYTTKIVLAKVMEFCFYLITKSQAIKVRNIYFKLTICYNLFILGVRVFLELYFSSLLCTNENICDKYHSNTRKNRA